ncbi:DUF3574 domain-containing protein [Fontivita pretiosa]|uniref:DUF3574 domain-containing protein n=1 Tax=Fontivita pretiosa TaxID=2989684 RepID=UPI003D17D32E
MSTQVRELLVVCVCLVGGCVAAGPRWTRTELYFGMSIAGGGAVSQAQWEQFVNEQITPRFPEGFTIVPAEGRYLQDGRTISEPSRLVILYYPPSRSADARINAIARQYAQQFSQDSVLRADSSGRVRFIGRSAHAADTDDEPVAERRR